jgi:ornithine cyclodeaminase/alanine dehydrogenase-like protein (mu-crystallin family)
VTRILDEQTVARLLPGPAEAVELARQTLVGLAEGTVELPPKPAVHPRPDGFVNVMPAYCAGPDLAGVKVVGVYPGNRARGLPIIDALIVVSDAETGRLRGLVAGNGITAARTAAASGACIARLRPAAGGHLAITGAGVEARSHLLVAAELGFAEAVVWDHRPANIAALAEWSAANVPTVAVRGADGPDAAVAGAGVVVTGIPIGARGGLLDPVRVRADALVLPLDYSTSVGAELANSAALLLGDDVGQLDSYRGAGHFGGWRELDGPVGCWLADDAAARPPGRVVVANLGVGAHDVVFADAVLRAAASAGCGVELQL